MPAQGEAIGILMFDKRRYSMAPGNVGNASSYAYPVRLKVVEGLGWYPPHADEWSDPRPLEVDLLVDAARTEPDLSLLERQLVDIAGQFADAHSDLGLILLECTTFPTFAAAIQQRLRLPVVDYIGFIDFIFKSLVCEPYNGFV
jgi:hypothetical protein